MVDRILPACPHPRFLKDEAKRRRRSGEFSSLGRAQFAIAREHGFRSWPALSTFVQPRRLDVAGRAAALVRAACSSDVAAARTLLAAEPELAGYDLATGCVAGDARTVAEILSARPDAATAATGPDGIPPILYAAFSRLLRAEPERAPGIREVVRRLLAAGAEPNAIAGDREEAPPIYGVAGVLNDPELTRMVLEAGADPDEGLLVPDPADALAPDRPWGNESLYHAAELRELAEREARVPAIGNVSALWLAYAELGEVAEPGHRASVTDLVTILRHELAKDRGISLGGSTRSGRWLRPGWRAGWLLSGRPGWSSASRSGGGCGGSATS